MSGARLPLYAELERLLCRAIMELSYCHCAETLEMVISAEGEGIISEGMKLLSLKDLSEEETEKYLSKR